MTATDDPDVSEAGNSPGPDTGVLSRDPDGDPVVFVYEAPETTLRHAAPSNSAVDGPGSQM